MDKATIIENIDKIRIARGMTKKQLAEAAGYKNPGSVCKRNSLGEISLDNVFRFAKALGVEPYVLLKGEVKEATEFEVPFDARSLYPQNFAYDGLVERYEHSNLSEHEKHVTIMDEFYRIHVPSLLDVIETDFSQRDREIIEMYWKRNMSLSDIARHYNLSRERVRQIIAKILRKIGCIKRREKYTMASPDEINEYRKEVIQLTMAINTHKERLSEAIDNERILVRTPIEELNLSVRPYNCLVRSGYHFVDELIGIPADNLTKIHGLGIKSLDELLQKLHEYGIEIEQRENGELFTAPIMTKENRFLTKGDN